MGYTLEDLIDIPLLQNMQEKLNSVYSFPSAIVDNDGKLLTVVAWQDICMKFHRKNPECEKECIKSDKYILEHLEEANPAVSYQCPHGLIDNATPIYIDGKHMGNFFTGQFFIEPPDVDFFKKQAKKYNFNEKDYLEAVEKVPVWTKEKLALYLDFIKGFIEIIAGLGLKNLKEIEITRTMKESELKYRSLIENSSDAIYCVDLNGQYQFSNHLFASNFGKTPDYFVGKTFWDVYDKENADFRFEVTKRVFETGKSESFEVNLTLPDKSKIYQLATANPIKDETGKVILNLTHATNITNIKKVQADLAESNQFNSQIINSVQEGIIVYDSDLRYKVWNSFMEKLSGFPASQVLGKYPTDVFPFLEDAGVIENLKRALNGENIGTIDFPFRLPDTGKSGWTTDKSVPFRDVKGKIIGVIGTVHDTTVRKNSEFELIKSKEKAEESDRLKSAFLANMSHEIRTPMNGILGFAELLKEPNLTGERQQDYIRIIEKSGERMLNTINSIIEISKIESGLMEINISESNINEQIEYIHSFFKPEADRKGIKLLINCALPTKEAIILTDREKLFAILTNLVKNAIKYTDNGSIEFGYKLETRNATTQHDMYQHALSHRDLSHNILSKLVFFVKDTGIGIPKDRQDAIFERFIQADIGDKRAYQGAGLGLAITKSYIEMLGGKIQLESEEGKGSIFYFAIPDSIRPVEKNISKATSVKPEEGKMKKLKILIVEDDEVSDLYITEVLQEMSYELLHAKTGIEAINLFQLNPNIDLILMDLKMPDMDGYEATRQIRTVNKEVLIIAQTAYGLSGDREKAIEAGCNEYISKPVDMTLLKKMIEKHF